MEKKYGEGSSMSNIVPTVEVLVVDLDNTLFLHTFWTRFFFRISKFFHRLALISETLNRSLAESLRNKRVVILSGRNLEEEKDLFEQKLNKHNIKYDEIILCPRTKVTMDWKRKELEKIKEKYGNYFWMDDMK